MPIEPVIRSLKVWRIVKETYRNRRKRFSLRFKLIAGLVNAGSQVSYDFCRKSNVLVALLSTVRQFFDPAHGSVMPEITDDEALDAANSFINISATASQVLGYAATGFLATQVNLSSWVFLFDALTFVVAGILLLNLSSELFLRQGRKRVVWGSRA